MSGAVIDVETSQGYEPADVEAEIAEIAGSLNVLNARLVKVTERALEADLLGHGIHTVAQWLAYQAGLSRATPNRSSRSPNNAPRSRW